MSTESQDTELGVPGACMCLAKPFDIGDVLTCIAGYVQPLSAGATACGLGNEATVFWPTTLERRSGVVMTGQKE